MPNAADYERVYGNKNVKALNVISLGIGQGELLVTPIQLANVTAAIANHGYYITPHIVKNVDGKPNTDTNLTKRRYTSVDAKHFKPVIEGMYQVFETGTARS